MLNRQQLFNLVFLIIAYSVFGWKNSDFGALCNLKFIFRTYILFILWDCHLWSVVRCKSEIINVWFRMYIESRKSEQLKIASIHLTLPLDKNQIHQDSIIPVIASMTRAFQRALFLFSPAHKYTRTESSQVSRLISKSDPTQYSLLFFLLFELI